MSSAVLRYLTTNDIVTSQCFPDMSYITMVDHATWTTAEFHNHPAGRVGGLRILETLTINELYQCHPPSPAKTESRPALYPLGRPKSPREPEILRTPKQGPKSSS